MPTGERGSRLEASSSPSEELNGIFFLSSIARPLVQDFATPGNYLVMDVVDHGGDLLIRCNEFFR